MSRSCKDTDLEMCATDLNTKPSKLIILSLHRQPTGYFNEFVEHLDDALKYPYEPKAEFVNCGDVNTYYLIESSQTQKQLTSLLKYDLSYTVSFATRIQNNTNTAIDNIFVDKSRINLSSLPPLINSPSDHDSQILTIKNIY
jgi:endonuclease/exonuclease/phosphatase family metal-dependent hydrolase